MTRTTERKVGEQNIISLIIEHHNILRESIDVLKNDASSSVEKKKHALQFTATLKVHAKAEENTLYERMLKDGKLRMKVYEGDEEHNIADQLVTELELLNFPLNWDEQIEAKAKVLAEIVEHHIDEEEDEVFPAVADLIAESELKKLGAEYFKECRNEMDILEESKPYSTIWKEDLTRSLYSGLLGDRERLRQQGLTQ
ncbi:MAG: hemerythrin domain-containing protein [Bdellovibrionales bacterium]